MSSHPSVAGSSRLIQKIALLGVLAILVTGCVKPAPNSKPWRVESTPTVGRAVQPNQADAKTVEPRSTNPAVSYSTREPGSPLLTPTPDAPHQLPTARADEEIYTVRYGDTLGIISQRYGVEVNAIIEANQISNPDILEVGISLVIPAPQKLPPGPDFKIIPDSELVAGPASAAFNITEYIQSTNGYLKLYSEEIDDIRLNGAEVVARVSREYSVNPRLLLALLQHEAEWLTDPNPDESTRDYPLGYVRETHKNLYYQLAWAANNLNRGYYLWKIGGVTGWLLADGRLVPPAETINAGTAALQHFFSLLYSQNDWEQAVGPKGFILTYQKLFGYPFDYALEPLIPSNLAQPEMQLPFERDVVWSFTGGPHGGWGSYSAWAAIDFAPPGEALGCVQSDAWVTAVAPGKILFAQDGAVIQDLDSDGFFQTGWSILYMHIETRDRVEAQTEVQPGDRIGHPSCEGGISNGTHVHLARRYNGEWISADGNIPFILDGWVSSGNGIEYDGWLTWDDRSVEAWDGRVDENQIGR